jgi:hypothetical protein
MLVMRGARHQAGELRKIPRIWFYSDSVVQVRALADAIDGLYAARQLSAHWHLVVTYSDATNPDTTFSLEPESPADSSLGALHHDLRVMAEGVGRNFCEGNDCRAESLIRARPQRVFHLALTISALRSLYRQYRTLSCSLRDGLVRPRLASMLNR